MDESPLHAALSAFLADHGREAAIALVVACAEFVLPLYATESGPDERLRRALRPERSAADLTAAYSAMMDSFRYTRTATTAAESLYAAAVLGAETENLSQAAVLENMIDWLWLAETAVHLALSSGSAQERLDLLSRLDGFPSFGAWLMRRLELVGEARG